MGVNEKLLRGFPDEWARRAATRSVGEIPREASDLLIEWVRRYNYGEAEIRVLLDELFTRAIAIAEASGERIGREKERDENPAMKSVGESVAVARRVDRAATRAVLDEVFQREAARGNPFYAFAQALKAIE